MKNYTDSHKIDKIKELDNGSIIVPARLTRVGVFEYPEGPQLRPDDEVFDPESLKTINDVPLTLEHPDEAEVNPENFKSEVIGHVINGSVKREGRYITADLMISDKEAIDLVRSKKISEISMGYTADEVNKSGVFEDNGDKEEYNSVQTNIRYNHASLVPEGRAGPMCRLITDSNKVKNMVKIDGKEYVEGSAEHIAALQKKIDKAEVALKEATSSKAIQERVKSRMKLLDAVKVILKDEAEVEEEAIADMDEKEVKVQAILTKFPDLKDLVSEASDQFINGLFDGLHLMSEKDEPVAEAAKEVEESKEDEEEEIENPEEVTEEIDSKKNDKASKARALRGFKKVDKVYQTSETPISAFQKKMSSAHQNYQGVTKSK